MNLSFSYKSEGERIIRAVLDIPNDSFDRDYLQYIDECIGYEFKDLNDRFDDVDKELLRIEAYLIRKPVNPDPD